MASGVLCTNEGRWMIDEGRRMISITSSVTDHIVSKVSNVKQIKDWRII